MVPWVPGQENVLVLLFSSFVHVVLVLTLVHISHVHWGGGATHSQVTMSCHHHCPGLLRGGERGKAVLLPWQQGECLQATPYWCDQLHQGRFICICGQSSIAYEDVLEDRTCRDNEWVSKTDGKLCNSLPYEVVKPYCWRDMKIKRNRNKYIPLVFEWPNNYIMIAPDIGAFLPLSG